VLLLVEKRLDVAATVQDVQNHYIFIPDVVNDDVLKCKEGSQAGV
jgi:hypothetical protein